jgi:tetratricopeptide (TPR) repeat protein
LGVVYQEGRRAAAAERVFTEAIAACRTLVKQDPTYLADMAITLTNLGTLLHTLSRLEEAEKAYREAFTSFAALAKEDPEYRPYVAMIRNHLARLRYDTLRLEAI